MVKTLSLYYWDTKLMASYGEIVWNMESRNPQKVIRVTLWENYGKIGKVLVNLFR